MFVIIDLYFFLGFFVVICGVVIVVFFKLVFYVCVNKWCREKKVEVKKLYRRKLVSMFELICKYLYNKVIFGIFFYIDIS